jgi:hypothetical protein
MQCRPTAPGRVEVAHTPTATSWSGSSSWATSSTSSAVERQGREHGVRELHGRASAAELSRSPPPPRPARSSGPTTGRRARLRGGAFSEPQLLGDVQHERRRRRDRRRAGEPAEVVRFGEPQLLGDVQVRELRAELVAGERLAELSRLSRAARGDRPGAPPRHVRFRGRAQVGLGRNPQKPTDAKCFTTLHRDHRERAAEPTPPPQPASAAAAIAAEVVRFGELLGRGPARAPRSHGRASDAKLRDLGARPLPVQPPVVAVERASTSGSAPSSIASVQ